MPEIDVTQVIQEAAKRADPKAILAIILAAIVWAVREQALGRLPHEKWKLSARAVPHAFGVGIGWLVETHLGGVLSSLIGSIAGAFITAWIKHEPWTLNLLVNAFMISWAASGMSTQIKAVRKQREDQAARKLTPVSDDVIIPDAPRGPPAPPAALLILCALPMLVACGHTKESISYNTLTTVTEAVYGVAEQLPKQCDLHEREAAMKAGKKEEKIAAATKVHDHCMKTTDAVEIATKTLKQARNAAKEGMDSKWIALAIDTLKILAPLLEPLDLKLPSIPGVL